MELSLKSKAVIVTGGSKGIGRAIALAFADEGANIAICAREEAALNECASELRQRQVNVYAETCDVANSDSLSAFLNNVRRAFQHVDVLVNNVSAFATTDDEIGWATSFEIDVMASLRAVWKVSPWMGENPAGGSILFISSIAALDPGWPRSYSAAKAALLQYTKCAARSLAASGIRVNAVLPGSISGDRWDRIKASNRKAYDAVVNRIPWRRLGTPEEIASVVVFLASERASWITGACVVADGGQCGINLY